MALGTQPVGKLLDFEQYIEHQIKRTRARIKTTDILTAGLILVTAALGGLFLEVVLDHAFGLPLWLRRVVLYSAVIGGAVFSALRIARPLISRVNGLYAAKTIELADPTFKNSLINYLTLRRHRDEISKSFLAAVEAKAVKDLTKVEIDAVVDQRRLLQMFYALAGVVVLFCVYSALTPKSILDSTRRALGFDVVRPTNTRLVGIKPGNHKVISGENVSFSVDIQGTRPGRVMLHYSVDGGKYFMTSEFAPGSNYYDPWQTTLKDVRQSMDYYLTGGDAESLRYHIEVLPAPMVTAVSLDYLFPPYTGVPPRKNVAGGNVEAIEGTQITVTAHTNEPAVSAYIDFSKGQENSNPRMEVSESDPRLLVGTFTVNESGSYTIKFKTTGGQVNPDPVVYTIDCIPDKAPTEVAFLRPDKPEITVPSNVRVPLVMTAADDFGVKEALLSVRQGNETLYSVNLLEKETPVRRFKGTFTIDLPGKKVAPGTQVEYWLTVRDTKEPIPNRAETPHQIIKIAAPASEDQVKKIDERAQKEKEDAEKQIPPEPAQAGDDMPDQIPPASVDDKPMVEPTGQQRDDDRANAQPRTKEIDRPDTPDRGDANPPANNEPPPLSPDQLARIQKVLNKSPQNGAQQPPRPAQNGAATTPPSTDPAGDSRPQAGANPPSRTNPAPDNASRTPRPNAEPPGQGASNPAPTNGAPAASNGKDGVSRASQAPNAVQNKDPKASQSPPAASNSSPPAPATSKGASSNPAAGNANTSPQAPKSDGASNPPGASQTPGEKPNPTAPQPAATNPNANPNPDANNGAGAPRPPQDPSASANPGANTPGSSDPNNKANPAAPERTPNTNPPAANTPAGKPNSDGNNPAGATPPGASGNPSTPKSDPAHSGASSESSNQAGAKTPSKPGDPDTDPAASKPNPSPTAPNPGDPAQTSSNTPQGGQPGTKPNDPGASKPAGANGDNPNKTPQAGPNPPDGRTNPNGDKNPGGTTEGNKGSASDPKTNPASPKNPNTPAGDGKQGDPSKTNDGKQGDPSKTGGDGKQGRPVNKAGDNKAGDNSKAGDGKQSDPSTKLAMARLATTRRWRWQARRPVQSR